VSRLALIALALFLLPALPVMGESQPQPPVAGQVAAPEGAELRMARVEFDHVPHNELDCTQCHHTWDGMSEIKGCSDSGCHSDMVAKKGEGSFYAAFHERTSQISCLGCHNDRSQADKKHGPVKCMECHVKNG
jgi:hypothetical protein